MTVSWVSALPARYKDNEIENSTMIRNYVIWNDLRENDMTGNDMKGNDRKWHDRKWQELRNSQEEGNKGHF